MRNQPWVRRATYLMCLGLAALIALWMLWDALPPEPEHYSSVHQMNGLPVLWGLAEDSLVNTGDNKALDTLPGVGEVISQRMIETREMIAGFRLPEDLMLVKGIGEKTFVKIMEALGEPLVRMPEVQE